MTTETKTRTLADIEREWMTVQVYGEAEQLDRVPRLIREAHALGLASRASPEWNGDSAAVIDLLRAFRDSVRFVRTRAEREALAEHAEAVLLIQKNTRPIESPNAKWPDPPPCGRRYGREVQGVRRHRGHVPSTALQQPRVQVPRLPRHRALPVHRR